MVASTYPNPTTLEELVEQILVARRITATQRQQVMQIFLGDSLSDGDLVLLDRLLYGTRKGLLQLAE